MIRESFKVKPHEAGLLLIDLLSERMRCSKKQVKALLDNKQVFVNDQRIWMAKHKVERLDVISCLRPETKAKKIEVLKKCGDILIINKPAGIVTNDSAKSLEARLQREMNDPQICAVHRLDRETSGAVIFAKNQAAKEAMIPVFKDQQIVKLYRAIVSGRVADHLKTITRDIDGQSATTLVRVLDRTKSASYLELRIKTGRTHQIRKHLSAVRHPVLGDKGYAGSKDITDIVTTLPRQMLHAYKLVMPNPLKPSEPLRVTAQVPADFKDALFALKLK